MDKRRILIVGDSTALPREEVNYCNTWVYLLKKELTNYTIENVSKWGETTNSLIGREKLEWYNPNIIILQLGICDCAPRLLTKLERKILSYLPPKTVAVYVSIIKTIRKKSIDRATVDSDAFMENINRYISRAEKLNVEKIIIIGILNSGKKYQMKNPSIQNSIDIYNNILLECTNKSNIITFLEMNLPENEVDEITIEDGFHYNDKGHKLIYEKIKGILKFEF